MDANEIATAQSHLLAKRVEELRPDALECCIELCRRHADTIRSLNHKIEAILHDRKTGKARK